MDVISKGILYVVSGPSGSGKTTLIKKLLAVMPELKFGVSFTTRSPREGERDGVDYRFVTVDEFRKMVEGGMFLEWAEVHGHLYGTPVSEVKAHLDAGRDVVLDVDVQGAASIRKRLGYGVYIFVAPPSREVLIERLKERDTERGVEMEERIARFDAEMEKAESYDYIIINDKMDEALKQLSSVVIAEHCRTERAKRFLKLR
jgi:guanylate kinase